MPSWLAASAVVLGLVGFALGSVLGLDTPGAFPTAGDTTEGAQGQASASASAQDALCGHAGWRTAMCTAAAHGSFVAQLNY